MKAIRAHEVGGPEVLRYEDVPELTPGPGQALVDIKAIGVNYTSRPGMHQRPVAWIQLSDAKSQKMSGHGLEHSGRAGGEFHAIG